MVDTRRVVCSFRLPRGLVAAMQDVIDQPGAEEYWPTKTSFIEQALWEHLKALGVDQHRYLYPEQLPLPSPVPSVGEIGKEVAELRGIVMEMQGQMGLAPPAPAGFVLPPPGGYAGPHAPAGSVDPMINPHAHEHSINAQLQQHLDEAQRRREEAEERRQEKIRCDKINRDIAAGRAQDHWYDDDLDMTEAHPDHPDHDERVYYASHDIAAGRVGHWYDDDLNMTEAHPDHPGHDEDVDYEPDD